MVAIGNGSADGACVGNISELHSRLVNASMLVHDDNAEFPYKTPFVHRIKQAFDEMLRKFAQFTAAVAPLNRVQSA
jgi:hypothetical protein